MIDRRLLTHFNGTLFGIALILVTLGLINLYSATSGFEGGTGGVLFKAQLLWTFVGFILLLFTISIHYRHYQANAWTLYGMGIFLLVLVLVAGHKVAGHQSWIALGPIRIQPSEMGKIALVFGLAKYFSEADLMGRLRLVDLIVPLLICFLPMLLVLMQGDLGSSLFYVLITMVMVLVFGVRWQVIVGVAIVGICVCVLAYFFFLSSYQKDRIATFMNPELDRKGAGYHLVQSKIAVGSGGFSGRGYMKGQTHKLKFVPERHTDFIFTVVGEEWGFVGGLTLLGLYLSLLLSGLKVALKSGDRFCFFLAVGATSIIFWHIVVNLGGVLGLMPLTGVPLPFFSYGGSSLITDWTSLGLLLNISMRRFMFN